MTAAAESLTIRCRHLLTMAEPPVHGGWVRIAGGRISACGRGRPGGRAVDLEDCIVLPGLVNAHTHLEFSDLRQPLDPEGGLVRWIERIVGLRRGRDVLPDAAARRDAAVRGGLGESAAAGVTAIGEIATALPPTALPGPRCRVFRETLGLSAAAAATAGRRLAGDLDELARRGLAAGVSPHAPYSVSAPLGRAGLAQARRRGLPVAMHLAESREEARFLADGSGPFRDLLQRLAGWPEGRGPDLLLPVREWISRLAGAGRGLVVHGTHLDGDGMALARLARHRDRLAVVVCPRTALALAGRLPPVRAFLEAGIRVAVGTDSRASAPDLSVLAECRTLVDAGVVSPSESLTMATRDAAWGLGFESRSGRLAAGRPADLVVLRPARAADDPAAAALDPATGVVATFRGGRLIAGTLA